MVLLHQYTKSRIKMFDDKNKIGKQHKTTRQQCGRSMCMFEESPVSTSDTLGTPHS